MPGMRNLFGLLHGNARPSPEDRVLSVRRTVLAISWLAINQSVSTQEDYLALFILSYPHGQLGAAETSMRQRPKRFWSGIDLGQLTLVRRRAEQGMRVGDRVLLKNQEGVPVTKHGKSDSHGPIEVRTLVVKQTRTSVNVLWQDGTQVRLDAKDTVPYLNPDEYDCW